MNVFQPIRQVAYCVPDVRAAGIEHARLYGSGPFFLLEHAPVVDFKYRGLPAEFDHSALYGQWGEIMVEFIAQHNPGPSHIHDMFPYGSRQVGLHHVALIVEDVDVAKQQFTSSGYQVSSSLTMITGGEIFMLDTRAVNGHMIEIYGSIPPILGFYEMVKQAAKDFDGQDLIRPIKSIATARPSRG